MFYQPKILLATTFPSNEAPCQNDLFPREREREKKKNLIFGATTQMLYLFLSLFILKNKNKLNQIKNSMTNSYISI
jgi:hypothetical protein